MSGEVVAARDSPGKCQRTPDSDFHFGRYDTNHSQERGPPARTKHDPEVCLRRVWRPALLTETDIASGLRPR
jgi:hypothetical protein